MSGKKLLYVFTKGPYSSSFGQEGLDALMIGAAFEQDVSVLFLHDGVFQIKTGQGASKSAIKIYTKAFAALEDFGVERMFAHDLSLIARGLTKEQLTVDVEILNSSNVQKLMSQQFRVFTF